jgi:hypothetical protein
MWIFENPKSYPDMCKKIAQAVFAISLIELFVLSQISPDFSGFMKKISFNTETEIINIKLYISYIYIPITLSILENIFKMHDKIGKLFKVRQKNAANVIFPTYMCELNIQKRKSKEEYRTVYLKNRDLQKAIGNHFYEHVSYSNPKIDSHDVYMALDSWGWFWIILDSACITILFLISLIISMLFKISVSKLLLLGLVIYIVCLLFLNFILLKTRCSYYTQREIALAVKYDRDNNGNKLNEQLKRNIENALCDK